MSEFQGTIKGKGDGNWGRADLKAARKAYAKADHQNSVEVFLASRGTE